MRVTIEGAPVDLDDKDLVGEGGEARVYAAGADDVVKVFHSGAPAGLVALRQQKLQALRRLTLPSSVMAPQALALGNNGEIVGYRMRRVRDAVDIARLARPASKALVSQQQTLEVFRSLLQTLRLLHAQGVVVGDLNDGNVLATPAAPAAFVIDVDSVQLPGLACPVAHERFLDPRLYGVALVDGPRFSADNDLYAFRVLLFQSLLCLHPYGGTTAALPTLLRRAEARHSALRSDVTVPRVALPAAALPDALLTDFAACFDDDRRCDFDARLLDFRFVRCACGLEHAHTICPACQARVARVAVPAVQVRGACTFEIIQRGRAVTAAVAGGVLRFVVDNGDALRREDGSLVVNGSGVAVSVGFVGRRTWLASVVGTSAELCAELCALEDGAVVDRTSTGVSQGVPVFAVSQSGLFRLHGDAIVHHDSGVTVGRAVPARTWLFADDDGCIAVWRAGNVARVVWCRPGRGPSDVALPPITGRLRDLHVVSAERGADGDECVLVCVASEEAGRVTHRLTRVSRTRGVLATLVGHPDDALALGSIRGKIVSGGQVLSVSKSGLVLLDGDLRETAVFNDTSDFVDDSVDILRGSGGDIFVVADAAIHLLRRRAAAKP